MIKNLFDKCLLQVFKILFGKKKAVDILNRNYISRISKTQKKQTYLLKENCIYKDIHKGKRCFILGNGPSLNTHDLTLLENEIVFTVNQISRHKDFKKIKPNYHFWADPIFFNLDLSNSGDLELLEKMKSINTEDNQPICFYELAAYDMIKKTELDKDINIVYYKGAYPFNMISGGDIDLSLCLPSFHTVVQYAIAAAIYMGFSEIYILGCESTSILTSINIRLNENLKNDYAYELTENEDKRMRSRIEKVSFEQELYSFYKVIYDYKLLSKYCEERGINLYNCTPGGLIEGIKRKKYESLF